jgi:hypothetical protein
MVLAVPGATAAPSTCLNCGTALGLPRPNFCPHCGQETNVKPPTLREFAQQFGGAFLSTEGALWRTLRLLLTRPGELTRQYLAGRRKHYVLPLRLYLTISVICLLLLRTLADVQVEPGVPPEKAVAGFRNVRIELGFASAGMVDGVFFCRHLPDRVCERLRRRLDVNPQSLMRETLELRDRFLGNLGGALFVLVPGFALWLKGAYLNRRLRFTEHLVFALHVHAFWFVALALMLVPSEWLKLVLTLSVPTYTLLAMRRVYGGRWWPRLLRAGVVSVLYSFTLMVGLALVGVWSILT